MVVCVDIKCMLTYDVAYSMFGFGSHWFESSLLEQMKCVRDFGVSGELVLLSYFELLVLLFDLEGDMWVCPVKGSDSQ